MIDVDLMLEEAEKQKAMHFAMAAGFTNSEIIFMLTRLREAEKDAARYRWLCEQAWFQVESEWQLILGETETEDDFIICANEKIDQAMKEKGCE
jgi:hypothetical protein